MVKVGQKVRFDPLHYVVGYGTEVIRGHLVTGTVVMVHEAHKYFLVEYGETRSKISVKFCDIGEAVKIVG